MLDTPPIRPSIACAECKATSVFRYRGFSPGASRSTAAGAGAPASGSRAKRAWQRKRARQAVETAEVVHVRVRHEDVGHAQDLPGRQRREIAKVEEQLPTLELQIDI